MEGRARTVNDVDFKAKVNEFVGATKSRLDAGEKRFGIIDTKLDGISSQVSKLATGENCAKGATQQAAIDKGEQEREKIWKHLNSKNGKNGKPKNGDGLKFGRFSATGRTAEIVIRAARDIVFAGLLIALFLELRGIDVIGMLTGK
jgi:hypothetical protein